MLDCLRVYVCDEHVVWLDDITLCLCVVCGVRSDDSTLCLHVVCGFLREGHKVGFLKLWLLTLRRVTRLEMPDGNSESY